MKYFVDNDGIHLIIDKPIPDNEAVESVKHIAAHVNNYQCDCAACREKRRNAIGRDTTVTVDRRAPAVDIATEAA